jgi:hypothetical protein
MTGTRSAGLELIRTMPGQCPSAQFPRARMTPTHQPRNECSQTWSSCTYKPRGSVSESGRTEIRSILERGDINAAMVREHILQSS